MASLARVQNADLLALFGLGAGERHVRRIFVADRHAHLKRRQVRHQLDIVLHKQGFIPVRHRHLGRRAQTMHRNVGLRPGGANSSKKAQEYP